MKTNSIMKRIRFIIMVATLFVCSSVYAYDGNGPKSGLKAYIEGGFAFGEGIYGEVPISFQVAAGYQINPYVFVGFGSGENFFAAPGVYGIPLYGDLRLTLWNNSISPFIDAKLGYSIADIEGLYFSPSIGCRIGTNNNTAFTISVGYELQKEDKLAINKYNYKSREYMGGVAFKFGFEF